MLKKFTLTALLLVALAYSGISQAITNYTFAASSGTFTALTSPINPTLTAGTVDEGYFNSIPIGFNFWYMGTRYTTISASTNGWLALGADITNASPSNNLTSGGTPRPLLAPLWDDLNIQAATNVSYLTTGTAGSRIFTIQYLNNKWLNTATGATISFQVRLYEGTGKIEYQYRQDATTAVTPTASIGIAATSTGNGSYLSLNGTGTAPTASSTTETATLSAKPANGQLYSFTSPVPNAPTALTFTSVTATGMTLNWTDNSTSNGRGFLVYRSTDNVNFTLMTQTAAGATSSAQTGLSYNTTYYWKVQAITEGNSSTALAGTQATPCVTPAAPTVVSPVNYCLNATAVPLTATGSNLLWGGGSGSVGGTASLATTTYTDYTIYNNKKTNFTTSIDNVTITSVDYYIPAYQTASGVVLSIFNSAGTVIATSTTNTSMSAGATAVKVTNVFNFTIPTAGSYSIGLSAGLANLGADNPTFPITEPNGTITVTGTTPAGIRMFNNIQFNASSSVAPTPSTAATGSKNYYVTQTVNGCVSPAATIVVNVNSVNISQLPSTGYVANFPFSGNANDVSGNANNGTLQGAPTAVADRFGNANSAYSFNGSTQYISTTKSYVSPNTFTISAWFKTNTTTGGRIIGFGTAQTGTSGQFDRHIYMNNAGQLYFGVYNSGVYTVNTTASYNDNNWHMATATLSSGGMALYVDGALVGTNTATTVAENTTGWWRIAYDNNSGWTSQPSNFYFTGTIDDVLIYDRALTGSEISTVYSSAGGASNNGPVCAGATLTLSAPTLSGATYAWTGPNGFTSTQQNPTINYNAAYAGTYAVTVTVNSCTATSQTNVVSTTTAGQWTGNTSTDWADPTNWCTGVVPTATTNVTITSTATRQPTISSAVVVNNLTINAGATVTTAAAGTLSIAGLLTNNGTMTNNGTTVFNGTTQQTFSGVTTFNHVTLNNAAGLLLPAAITANNVTITTGTLNANNFNIDVKGSWTNNSSATAFTAGTASVTFTGTTAQTIGGTFETTFNSVTASNVGSTITMTNNMKIAGNLIVGGVLDLVGFTANRTTSGGTLYINNTGYLKIGGTNTLPSNYTTNTFLTASTVEYSGTNQTVSSQTYGNLVFSSSAGAVVKTSAAGSFSTAGNFIMKQGAGTSVTFSPSANLSIGGDVNLGANTTWNGGSYTHTINGNWTNNGTYNGNTSTIVFAGANKTVSGAAAGQLFNSITIAASGVLFFDNTGLTMSGSLATTGSGSFTQLSGGTLTMTGNGATISGNAISIDNLTITGSGKVTAMNSLTFTGNLTMVNAANTFTGNTGTTITLSGASKTISGAGSGAFATLNITGSNVASTSFSIATALVVDGSFSATAGTATFTGTASLSGRANLFTVVENGTKLQLSGNSVLGIANTLSFTAGTLDVTTSVPNTVEFNGGAQNINAITYNNLVLTNGNTKSAISALQVNNTLTIGPSTTFAGGNYTHSIYGDWVNNGTYAASTSVVRFAGSLNSNLGGSAVTTFNELTVDKSTVNTLLLLSANANAAIVNMTQGRMNTTATRTITITTTRTGPSIIIGNITRTHAFTTGTDYAFESPYNTVNFSAVSGVTSITVTVTLAAISDFPAGASINRLYNITVPSGTYTAKLRLHYEDNELNGNNESSMTLWRNPGSGWAPIGAATGRDATNNYVENSGLTDITNRWTCSQAPSEFVWSGVIDEHWDKPGNWKYGGVAAITIPQPSDVVNLGTETFNFHPTISTAVTVKNINFGSVKAVNLSMTTGGSLITGNMAGIWTANATHNINAADQTININGSLALSDGTTGHAINLNIGTGTVAITGVLTESGNANVTFTGNGKIQVGSHFTYTNGTFTPGTGTVEFNGSANQSVAGVTYYNVTVNKTGGTALMLRSNTIGGDLNITNGYVEVDSTCNIRGNVTIGAGTTLENDYILRVGGNWNNNGTYLGVGVNVVFDGSGTQNISSTTFNNLEFNKPVGSIAQLTGDVTLKGNLVGTSGTLDIKSYFFNRDAVGGSATLYDNGTLIIAADNAPTKFSNYFLGNGSTVIFNGTTTQHLALPGVTYGNLIFRNSGTKTLYVPVTINTKLTIESGATFEAGNNTITLNGDWQNDGTFTPQTSTVLWNGTNKTIAGVTTFNKVTVGGKYNVTSNVTFNDLFNVTAAGVITAPSGSVNTVKGDFTNSGDMYLLGETIFTGTQVQTLSLLNAVRTVAAIITFNGSVSPVLNSTSAPQFNILNVNNTGGVNPSVGWTILSQLNVGAGASFNGGVYTQNLLGTLTNNGTITTSGTFNFIPTAAVTLNLGSNFTSTGTVVFGSTGAITLTGTPNAFNNVTISNTNAAGITPSSNWLVNNNFTVNAGSIFNANSRTYTVKGNIKNVGTINSGTSLFALTGTAQQDITSGSAFNNITMNKTTGIANMLTNISMNGALTFTKGVINTGSFALIQTAGATVTGASQSTGWVNGKLQKNIATGATTKQYETGDANYYTPVNVVFANVTTAGDMALTAVPTEHPAISSSDINSSKSLNRYYSFVNSGVVFTTCDVTMNFVASDVDAGANTANFSVENYNGSSWAVANSTNANPTNIKVTGMTWLGDLACGEICNKGTAIAYTQPSYCNTGSATPTITGTLGGVFSADAGVVINASTGVINLSSTPIGTYRVFYTVASTGTCHEYRTSTSIVIVQSGTWTGLVNNDWNNSGNWSCGGIPTASTNVSIPSSLSFYPVITSTIAVHDITITAGASITLDSTGIFQIGGAISNAGIFDVAKGTIELTGNVNQTIPVKAFKNNAIRNLTISNTSTSGVIMGGAIDVYGLLSFTGTGQQLVTNDSLTMKSSVNATANVGILTGNLISGKVTVERYINTGTATGQHPKSWQLLSSTTNGQTFKESWMENGLQTTTPNGYGMLVTGAGGPANGFDVNSGTTIKYYNPAANAWVPIGNPTTTLVNSQPAYMAYIRGDRSVFNFTGNNSGPVPTVLRSKGTLNIGTQPAIKVAADGTTLVGNPYAAVIDFSRIIKTGGVDETFYVWDPTVPGAYASGAYQTIKKIGSQYLATPGANRGINGSTIYDNTTDYRYIQSGEAFFVRASMDSGTVQFAESQKAIGDHHILVNRIENDDYAMLSTNLLSAASGTLTLMDGNRLVLQDGMSNNVNGDDALKFANSAENFGLKRAGKSLAVESRSPVATTDTLYYNMTNMLAQNYQLMFIPQNMDPLVSAVLIDKWAATRTPVSLADTSYKTITVTTDAASKAADRFMLVFTKAQAPLPVTITSVSATRNADKTIDVKWKVENEINMDKYFVERSGDGTHFSSINNTKAINSPAYVYTDVAPLNTDNYYRIKALSNGGTVQYSAIVKVTQLKGAASVSVYPNPVVNKTAQIQFNNMPKGTYLIEITNRLGQVLYSSSTIVNSASFAKAVALGDRVSAGIYQLRVIAEDGTATTQQIVVE